MILGKDKIIFKEMEEELTQLKLQNIKLQGEIQKKDKTNFKYCEITKELENLVKAIVFKFNNHQIEIDEDDIKKAERGEIYIEQSYMKFAKIVKIIFKENKLKNIT